VSPNPNNGTQAPDGYPGVVWVTATVTDASPNASAVKSAEGFIDPVGTPAPHSGWTMLPVDGVFDQPVEQVYAQIPLSEISILTDGSHVFSIRGLDAAGNWGALGTGTLQIDKTGPVITAASLTPAARQRGQSTTLNATAADGSLVDRFEYFLDQGPATSVSVTPGTPRSLTRSITVPFLTSGQLHYVLVRAHDGAGNWGAWTQLALTVTNAFGPLSAPADLGPVTGIGPVAAPLAASAAPGRTLAGIAVRMTGEAHLVSIKSARNVWRARFAFAPRGVRIHGTKTIMRGRNATGHVVLIVQVRGSAHHRYLLRAVSGGKHTAWLSLGDRRVVLEAALRLGKRPTLNRAH
jgi:hypothetical protein